MVLPGTTEDPPNKAFVKLPRAKLGGHRRSKHKAASVSMASSVGSESLGFGRPQIGRPAPGDTRRFFRAVDAADCSDPASLRRLGISYPKTTVLKMELSFARLNPPADVDRDREPVPVVDPADLEKLRQRVVLTGWDLRKSRLTAQQRDESKREHEKLKWERLARNFRPGKDKHTSSFPKLDALPDILDRGAQSAPSGGIRDRAPSPDGEEKKRKKPPAIVEAQASIARMESVATSAHAEFRGVSETVRDASRTDPYYDGLDCDALDRRGASRARPGQRDAGGANLTLVDALAAAPFVDLSPLLAASTTVGTILASMTSVRRSNAKGVKSFDLFGPRLAAVGGALAQIEPVLGPVNAQLLQRAPKSADDAKSLTKMIEGFATWFAPFGSATSLPALGQVCVDVIDVVETVPLEHDYTLHDVAPPTNYEWDGNAHEENASDGALQIPRLRGARVRKHHGYEETRPGPSSTANELRRTALRTEDDDAMFRRWEALVVPLRCVALVMNKLVFERVFRGAARRSRGAVGADATRLDLRFKSNADRDDFAQMWNRFKRSKDAQDLMELEELRDSLNASCYVQRYADLRAVFCDSARDCDLERAKAHWVEHGEGEGRVWLRARKLVGGWCAARAYQRGAKAPRRSHHKASAWPLPGGATITVDTLFSRVDESLLAADDVLYRVDERGETHVEVLAVRERDRRGLAASNEWLSLLKKDYYDDIAKRRHCWDAPPVVALRLSAFVHRHFVDRGAPVPGNRTVAILKTAAGSPSQGVLCPDRVAAILRKHRAELLDPAALGEIALINALAAATTLVVSWGTTSMKNYVYVGGRCTDIYVYYTADFAGQANNPSARRSTFRNATIHYVAAEDLVSHSHHHHREGPPDVTIKWVFKKSGEAIETPAYFGENLLRLAQRHDIPLEGACEGVTACSTCHCILEDDFFDELEEELEEDEEDMLDQAFGLTPTSRLGCQLKVDERFDGAVIMLPEATLNFATATPRSRTSARLRARRRKGSILSLLAFETQFSVGLA
ncbi:hypothetical protein JL720_17016 [Aureococcus anophagefferens]|nr:hypothetical protein JL720_17016 [Aureococcus anophagefferens]